MSCVVWQLRLKSGLHVEFGELDLVTDEHATGLERGVVLNAEILAVDLAGGLEASLGVAPRVGVHACELNVELDGLRDTTKGEVADQLEVAARTRNGGRRGGLRSDRSRCRRSAPD